MLNNYIPILMIFALAIIFGIVSVMLSKLLGPKKPNPIKLSTYESGMDPIGTARGRFSVKFYIAAMLFILFDIEIVFLYPWAVVFKTFDSVLLAYVLIEMLIFIAILLVGYIYIIRKGALKWD